MLLSIESQKMIIVYIAFLLSCTSIIHADDCTRYNTLYSFILSCMCVWCVYANINATEASQLTCTNSCRAHYYIANASSSCLIEKIAFIAAMTLICAVIIGAAITIIIL